MRLVVKKIEVFILVFLVFSFPIFNCCLLELAHANTVIQKAPLNGVDQMRQKDWYSHDASNTDASDTKNCHWDGLSVALLDPCNYLKTINVSDYNFYLNLTSSNLIKNLLPNSNKLSSLHSPPLTTINTVPIYVKNSSLLI